MARNTEEDSKPGKKGRRTAAKDDWKKIPGWNTDSKGKPKPKLTKKGGVIRGMKSGGLARRRRS